MCCKLIPSFCMLLSVANAVHLGHYGPQEEHYQDVQPQEMQRKSIKLLRMGPQIMQPQGMQPQGMQPQGMQPQYIEPQADDKKCAGCIININCGGADCMPTVTQQTPTPPIWTLPPTQTPGWTPGPPLTPKPTTPPHVTPGGCRLCPCYIPPPCQICQPCQ
uniref:Major microfilarial sheath protein, putative n=1 Tax=Brugia malayi TaxID=6279 RepID=A0A7I4KPL1_BRUMA